MKVCTKCDELKPFSDFYKYKLSKDGYQRWCKSCHKQANEEKAQYRKIHGPSIVRHHKTCLICNNTKPISQFFIKRGYSADGYGAYCKPCWSIRSMHDRKKRGQ